MNYGPLGDPGSYGTARSMIPEGKMTPIEYPQAMPFSRGGGGGGIQLGGGRPPWWREDSLWAGEVDGGRGIAHLFGNTGMTPGPVPTASPNFNFNSAPAGVSLSGPLSSGGVSLRSPRRNYSNPTRRYGL